MRIKKSICVCLAMSMLVGSNVLPNSKVFAETGTVRDWSLALPHDNGNYYFPFRTKETNEKKGYVRVKKIESSGVNVWFNKGTSLKDVVKITDVVKFRKKPKKMLNIIVTVKRAQV